MKIYNKIVIDIDTGKTVYEDSFEYAGHVAECKGGGSSHTTTVDKEYNAGMLALSQEQQDWAREMFNMFKYGVNYDPNKKVTGYWKGEGDDREWVDAPKLPWSGGRVITTTLGEARGYDPNAQTSEMQYLQNVVNANQSLLPAQTELASAQISDTLTGIEERAPVREKFYSEALGGVDVGERMDQAQADVEHGFKLSGDALRREAMSYGVNPNAGRFASIMNKRNLNKATAIAGARRAARDRAEEENFARLRSAMTSDYI